MKKKTANMFSLLGWGWAEKAIHRSPECPSLTSKINLNLFIYRIFVSRIITSSRVDTETRHVNIAQLLLYVSCTINEPKSTGVKLVEINREML